MISTKVDTNKVISKLLLHTFIKLYDEELLTSSSGLGAQCQLCQLPFCSLRIQAASQINAGDRIGNAI
ncbi:hypothetical protein M404DRAFT_556043 [Pisolithus tinctorius Marx 270]|uniref:Uncharacterized protein n=1 Tax=Pisolithus tinctorius Marx 270 TaxID=870435 RepID=A0A0C3P9I0_PISTI|nr:hypothetical protein M404DRAFT_556043 [Pisolithus tinctorius Marx 270]